LASPTSPKRLPEQGRFPSLGHRSLSPVRRPPVRPRTDEGQSFSCIPPTVELAVSRPSILTGKNTGKNSGMPLRASSPDRKPLVLQAVTGASADIEPRNNRESFSR